jgi:hypothetical protein
MAVTINASTSAGLVQTADTSGVLQLQTANTTAVTVDASQNVGIGTTSPQIASGFTNLVVSNPTNGGILYVDRQSGARGYFYANGTTSVVLGTTAASNVPLTFQTADTERMRIDSSGNVGIGTASPSKKLSIATGATNQVLIGTSDTAGTYNAISLTGSTLDASLVGLIGGGGADTNLYIMAPTSLIFRTAGSTERMQINSSGSLILAGSTAQKATGTTWSNPSDQRLKDNIRDYTKGTNELMQVRVREWEYNGKGGTTEGMSGLGVVADEVMTVLPNTVETYDAKLNADDEETTAIKKFDATEITWLLVKTVQEQQTIINDLTARITALEGAA